MRYCKTCKIHYDTDLEACVLCGGDLEYDEHDHSVYKFKEASKKPKSNFFLRLFVFLNFMSVFVTLALDYLSGLPLTWSLIVSATNIYTVILLIVLANPNFWVSKFTKIVIFSISIVILIGLSLRDNSLSSVQPVATLAMCNLTSKPSILILLYGSTLFLSFILCLELSDKMSSIFMQLTLQKLINYFLMNYFIKKFFIVKSTS